MATRRHQSGSDEALRLARTGLAGRMGPALLLFSALVVKAVVLAAATGVLTFNEVLLLQSAVDPFLTALASYLVVRALVTDRLTRFATAGLALGVFVTNRPNVLAWAAVLVVLLAVVPLSRKSL